MLLKFKQFPTGAFYSENRESLQNGIAVKNSTMSTARSLIFLRSFFKSPFTDPISKPGYDNARIHPIQITLQPCSYK